MIKVLELMISEKLRRMRIMVGWFSFEVLEKTGHYQIVKSVHSAINLSSPPLHWPVPRGIPVDRQQLREVDVSKQIKSNLLYPRPSKVPGLCTCLPPARRPL